MTGSEDPTRIHPTAPAPPAAPPGGATPPDGGPLTPHGPTPGGPRTPADPPLPPTGGGRGGGDGWDDGPDEPDHTGRNRNWILAVGAGALVLIALFLGLSLLGNDDDEGDGRTPITTPAEIQSTPATTPATSPAPAPEPKPEESTDNGGNNSSSGGATIGGDDNEQPADDGPLLTAGSVTKLQANQGDTVTFQVQSDTDEEVHVHGYDLKYDIAAGETKSISFEATLTGIFEIEFEGSGTQIGELTVEP